MVVVGVLLVAVVIILTITKSMNGLETPVCFFRSPMQVEELPCTNEIDSIGTFSRTGGTVKANNVVLFAFQQRVEFHTETIELTEIERAKV